MQDARSIEAVKFASARGAAYGLIAHGFHYPDEDTLSLLVDPRRFDQWPEVLQAADGETGEVLQSVQDALREFADCPDKARQGLRDRYDILFGHSVRGACPVYEMEYGRHEIIRQASDLADLAGFYRAFGLDIADGADGRPDHVAAECEFMSALCLKEAYAHAQGNQPNVDICCDAERVFLRDHLARWLPAFVRHVQEADAGGLFAAFARLADVFVKAECGRFDVDAGPPTLELRAPDPVQDTQISCGTGGCGGGSSEGQLVQLGTETVPGRNR